MPEILASTIADIPALTALINSAYRGDSAKKGWTHEADLLSGTRIDANELKSIIGRNDTSLLKYVDSRMTGCILLEKQGDTLYLGMLTVLPEFQGGGIGKKLLAAAEEQAKTWKCNKIQMTVIDVRHELIDWYKTKGYTDTGVRKPFPNAQRIRPGVDLEFILLEKKI